MTRPRLDGRFDWQAGHINGIAEPCIEVEQTAAHYHDPSTRMSPHLVRSPKIYFIDDGVATGGPEKTYRESCRYSNSVGGRREENRARKRSGRIDCPQVRWEAVTRPRRILRDVVIARLCTTHESPNGTKEQSQSMNRAFASAGKIEKDEPNGGRWRQKIKTDMSLQTQSTQYEACPEVQSES